MTFWWRMLHPSPYPHMLQTAIRRQLPAQDLLLIRASKMASAMDLDMPGTIS